MKNQIQETLKAGLLDEAPVAIVVHDADYKIKWANKAYKKQMALSFDEITGKKCYSLKGFSKPCYCCPAGLSLETGEPAEAELSFYKQSEKCSARIFYLIKSIPVRDENGVVYAVAEFIQDITAGKCSEQALQKSESGLKEAQRLAQMGSWELDLKTNILSWSDEIYRIFEILPSSFDHSYAAFLDVVHPDDRAMVDEKYRESIQSKLPYSIEHRILLKQGRIKFVHDRCETYYDHQGNPVRSIGTVQDITKRKLAEEEYKKLQAQYAQAQKMESVGRLAGGVAHDFNNMLSVILGNVDMALDDMEEDDSLYRTIMEIYRAARRSAALTHQLLAFARSQTIAPKFLNLNDIVGDMIKMLCRLIGENIDLAWIPASDLGMIKMDPGQIEQILANLCVNARDAISGIGKVTIETHNAVIDTTYAMEHPGFIPGSYVMLAVSDDGCGMHQETLTKLFEPFFTTKQRGKGTGLGLATVYGIVKQNKGFINVYSEPGKGTTFKIYLSRHESEDVIGHIEVLKQEPQGGGEVILLVEDETMILNVARIMLESIGYQVLAAGTPGEAIRMTRDFKGNIDLLLTDVVMPEMNGRELALKMEKCYPGIKTLFMSGYTANVIAHHGVLQDGVKFLHKPFLKSELAAKVREAIMQ